MKRVIFIAAFFILNFANAQSKQQAAVTNAVQRLHKAMIDANKTELEAIAADKLSYGHSSGAVDDKSVFVEKLVSGRSDFVSITAEEMSVSVSGKTAIVRHILRAKTNDAGKPGEVNLKVMLVWQKQQGNWKLLARQAVKLA
jgi:Domain of unknown function (DUF4440)